MKRETCLKKNGEKDASANILKRFREGAGEMLERSVRKMTKSATKKPNKKIVLKIHKSKVRLGI